MDRVQKGSFIPSHLLSPTPIRPLSPLPGSAQNSPRRLFQSTGSNMRDRPRFLGEDHQHDQTHRDQLDELSMEIFDIFTNSPRTMCASGTSSSSSSHDNLPPPSRNSNPLVRDRKFSTIENSDSLDSLASSLSQATSYHEDGCFSPIFMGGHS